MISIRKIATTGLVALTFAGASIATSTQAEARGGRFVGGLIVGGLVGAAVASHAYAGPRYYGGPSYYAGPSYVYGPSCHKEWRHDRWGNAYKVKVCY